MKKIVLFLLCIFIIGCNANNDVEPIEKTEKQTSSAIVDQGVLYENDEVYDFTVSDNEGNKITLAETLDTPTLLCFWTSWAENCEEVNQTINEVSQQYSNIDYVSVNVLALEKDNLETIIKNIRASNYNYRVYFDYDNSVTLKYHINSFPTIYIIDTNGKITNILRNKISKDEIIESINEIE